MQGHPFNIKTLLFDLLLCVGTILIGAIISTIICIMWTESREEGLGKSVFLAIPLGAILFYTIRRRFSVLITVIQIIITTLTTLGFGYLAVQLTDYLPPNFIDKDYWIVFITAFIAFVLSKHLSDIVVLNRIKYT